MDLYFIFMHFDFWNVFSLHKSLEILTYDIFHLIIKINDHFHSLSHHSLKYLSKHKFITIVMPIHHL